MKDIKIVIGSGFGDEGKGLMTDYFSRKTGGIVVCSNGGAQRGHTVVMPDGIRHVFHHFGSGTFNQASTYLSENFILNPIIFKQEYAELIKIGCKPIEVYINKKCMITTPFDMMANQIIEESRGKNKHGSCGLGIYETIKRYQAGITDLNYTGLRRYYIERFEMDGIALSDKWKEIFYDNGVVEHFMDDLDFMWSHCIPIKDSNFLNHFDNIIFEAGQGLLLDQNNMEYFPHLTPSNTGIKNPKRIIENMEWNDDICIETCYVTRTYMTRHGAGKFPTECDKSCINPEMYDKTNVPNPHQDTLRYGLLDLGQLHERCVNDVGDFGHKKSIAFTHINEYPVDKTEIEDLFEGWDTYFSDGETRNNVIKEDK
mgnify:CR=1 FL=1